MDPIQLLAEPLRRDAFADFGDLLEAPLNADGLASNRALRLARAVNSGTALRFDNCLNLDVLRERGEPCVALFHTEGDAHQPPYRLRTLERHVLGGQTFVPLGSSRCLAIVATGEGIPALTTLKAFLVEPGQAFTVRAGVWHHPLLTLGSANILVLERRGQQVDCETFELKDSIIVTLPNS